MSASVLRTAGRLGGLRFLIVLAILTGDVLVAAFLGAERKGLWHLFLQASLILTTLGILGQTISYNWAVRNGVDLPGRLLSNLAIIVLTCTVALMFAVWLGLAPLGRLLGGVFLYLEPRWSVFVGMVAAQVLFFVSAMVATTSGRPVAWFGLRLAYRVGMVALIGILGLVLPNRSDILLEALLWMFAGTTTLVALAGFALSQVRPARPSKAFTKQMNYGLSTLPVDIVMRRGAQIELLVVASVAPLAAIGAYTVAASFSRLFTAVGDVFKQLLYSRDVRASPDETVAALRLQFVGSLILLPVFALGLSIVVIPLLYAAEFSDAAWLVFFTLPAAMMAGLCSGLMPVLMQDGQARRLIWITLALLLVRGVLTYLLYAPFGIAGAALAGLIGYGLLWLYLLWMTAQRLTMAMHTFLIPSAHDKELLGRAWRKLRSKFKRP